MSESSVLTQGAWIALLGAIGVFLGALARTGLRGGLAPLPERPAPESRRFIFVAWGGAIVAAGWVFAPALGSFFINDDWKHIQVAQELLELSPLGAFKQLFARLAEITEENVRIVGYLSWVVRWVVLGSHSVLYHVEAIGEHLVDVALVFLLARRLTGRRSAGIAASAFFLVHTVQAETVGYLSAGEDRLVTALVLAVLLAHIAWRDGRSARFRWGSMAGTALALLAKEMALVIPAAVLLVDLFAGPGTARGRGRARDVATTLRSALRAAIPHLVVVGVYLVWRYAVLGHMGGYRDSEGAMVHLAFDAGATARSFFGVLLPGLVLPRQLIWTAAWVTPAVLTLWAVLFVLGTARGRFSAAALAVGGGLIVLAFAPVHNLLPTYEAWANSRYLQLAAAGFACIVGAIVAGEGGRPLADRVRWGCFALLLVYLGGTCRGTTELIVSTGTESRDLLRAVEPFATEADTRAALVLAPRRVEAALPPEVHPAWAFLGLPGRPLYSLGADGRLEGEGDWGGRPFGPGLLGRGSEGRLLLWSSIDGEHHLVDATADYLAATSQARGTGVLELEIGTWDRLRSGADGRLEIELPPRTRTADWAVLELKARFETGTHAKPGAERVVEPTGGIDIQTVGGPEGPERGPVVIVYWNGEAGEPPPPERRIHAVFAERSGGIDAVDLGSWPAWCLDEEPLRSIGFELPAEGSSAKIVRAALRSRS